MNKFTHLHVHTQYSILDGLATIPGLIKKAYNDGQRAMAVTDHGNMYGIYTFVSEVEKLNEDNIKKLKKEAFDKAKEEALEKKKTAAKEEEKNKIELTPEEIEKLEPEPIHYEPFKAIIGCEVYVARGSRFSKKSKEDRSGHHLILLAKNMEGYKNLSRMVSYGWIEGEYYKPRIDKELMRKYSKGVIASSACLGGELPQIIMRDNPYPVDDIIPEQFNLEAAGKVVEEFIDIFGDDYYLELQRNGHKEQKLVNEAILQLAKKYNVKCIATNDVHFVEKEDYPAHKMLICINTNKEYVDDKVASDEDSDNGMAYSGEEYFRTHDEMSALFADHPEVIANTQEIVDKVEVISLHHPATLPRFEVPAPFKDEFDYLQHLTWEGAKKRWGENLSDEIKERLEFELNTVKGMGYPGYFLIVLDFIEAGKKNGIRFGPGRGSAAGSAIAYCLNITNIDPIKYDLLFERFLNPDRISLPDMDIDMDSTGREKTIQYVSEKYGKEKVAVIVTFGEMKGKSAIRDCARAIKLPLERSNYLAKLVPDNAKSLAQAIYGDEKKKVEAVPELRKTLEEGSDLEKKTMEFALKLDGTIRNTGVHACGVIIGRDSLFDCIPLATSKNSETMVTEYEGSLVEDAGLLKMDFLGLKTLDIISKSLYNIKKRYGIDIEIDDIPLDDPKTFELFQNGDMTAVFQFESPGMRKYLRELKPERFADIIAMVSLYRPGPMDNIPSFIRRKNGQEKIEYPIPEMAKILDETYGITVYQEQVMQLSRLLAGFTRGDADTLRKAMGKKKIDVMEKMNKKFIDGGTKNKYKESDLKKIWEEWRKFAEYAFNKSHATCYAFVSYQTAWLKANYMAEFLAANLTMEINDLKKVAILIDEAKIYGIKVLPPDINESELDFTVNNEGAIRFGLAALKGVGANSVLDLVKERNEHGRFSDIFNFIERINLRSCNRRVIENMACVGTFDSFGNIHRAQFFAEDKDHKTFVEKLITYGSRKQGNSNTMQFSIFDEAPAELSNSAFPPIPNCTPWSNYEQLKHEKEIAGFYISGHPLDEYQCLIQSLTNTTLNFIKEQDQWKNYTDKTYSFAAMVADKQEYEDRNGRKYGVVHLEDYENTFSWWLYKDDYSKNAHLFQPGQFLFVEARISELGYAKEVEKKRYALKPVNMMYLGDAYHKKCKNVRLKIDISDISSNFSYILKDLIDKVPGNKPLIIEIISLNSDFSCNFYNHEKKIDPEKFIGIWDKTLPAMVSLD